MDTQIIRKMAQFLTREELRHIRAYWAYEAKIFDAADEAIRLQMQNGKIKLYKVDKNIEREK